MWVLSNPSSLLQVITGSAGAVAVHASWVDSAQGNIVPQAGAITPTGQNVPSITGATTTTVVPSPGATVTSWSISGTTLTVTSGITGTVPAGAALTATGIGFGLNILTQLTGTLGGAGTYQLSASSTNGSGTLTLTAARTVQKLIIVNTSVTIANQITVQHNDGTNTVTVYSASLAPGEFCMMTDQNGWQTYDKTGALKTLQTTALPAAAYAQVRTVASGTTDAGPTSMTSGNCLVLWNSATAGAKTSTMPTAAGTNNRFTIIDVAQTAQTNAITATPATGSITGNNQVYTKAGVQSWVDTSLGWVAEAA
jgi:hypothetical protein